MQIGEVIADRYRLDAKIGTGPLTRVYLAYDLHLTRQVAIKEFLGPDEEHLLSALHRSSLFSHPGVLTIIDFGADDNSYVVTEYCSGGSLADEIDAMGPLGYERVCKIALQACDILSAAHSCGLLHLGLKPQNILFDDSHQLKIADFGLSTGDSETTVVRGSLPAYRAPEQASGERVTTATDIFSFGLVLAEAVAGKRVVADTFGLAILSEGTYRPKRAFECNGNLKFVIERATRLDPSERFNSFEDLANAIRATEPMPSSSRALGFQTGAPLPAEIAARPHADQFSTGILGRSLVATALEPIDGLDGRLEAKADNPTRRRLSVVREDTEIESSTEAESSTVSNLPAGVGRVQADSDTPVDQVIYSNQVIPINERLFEIQSQIDQDIDSALESSKEERQPGIRSRIWSRGLIVLTVLVAISLVAIWSIPVFEKKAPELLGMTLDGARSHARISGVSTEVIATVSSTSYPKGLVIGQSPSPGGRLGLPRKVLLTLSAGPPPVPVPVVTGMNVFEATERLARAGLVALVSGTAHSNEPAGQVIAQEPGMTQAEFGSAVHLTVSSSPEPSVLPDLTGKSAKEARVALEGLRAGVVEESEYSETVKAGSVISTSPEPGLRIRAGHPVTLVVSKGPRVFVIPDVRGSRVTDAAARLQALGLTVKLVQIVGQERVVSQDPPAGSQVKKGQTVTLTTGP